MGRHTHTHRQSEHEESEGEGGYNAGDVHTSRCTCRSDRCSRTEEVHPLQNEPVDKIYVNVWLRRGSASVLHSS